MFEVTARIGYRLVGFTQKDEESFILMGQRESEDFNTPNSYATWEYGLSDGVPSLYWGHYDLDFEAAREDMARRAGGEVKCKACV